MKKRHVLAGLLFLFPFVLFADEPPRLVTVSDHGMVATDQRIASQVGVDILKAGGNAVDAAVAVGYALGVVEPCCGNIGGGGFMLLRMHDGRERFIDFREKAPALASRDMYLDQQKNIIVDQSRKGWMAIGVPGTVMGLEVARKEYGTLSRQKLIAPSIKLAREGFPLTEGDLMPFKVVAKKEAKNKVNFENQPNVKSIFLVNGELPPLGYILKQPQLAKTLEIISKDGTNAFYRGPIARAIVDASQQHGGILTMDDFKNYTVEQTEPLHCNYQGYKIVSAPPPSSGGVTLCEILNIIEPYPIHEWGWHSEKSLHYIFEAERRAYADRNAYLGDPAFVKNPIKQLLDPNYAKQLRDQIDAVKATPSSQVQPGLPNKDHESVHTTHYSIVDKQGNAVAVTYTLNGWFGSGVIAGDTGFFLNNEMDDFTSKVGMPNMYGLAQGERNEIQPGKRPLSSMTPTLVLKDGKLRIVTGSPGGARITTITVEALLNVLDYGMNAQEAADAPRTHMQWLPDKIQHEPNAMTADVMTKLKNDGYTFEEIPWWGSVQMIVIDPKTGKRYGGSDRRHTVGAAVGY